MKAKKSFMFAVLGLVLGAQRNAAGANATSLLANVPESANYDLVYQLDIPAGASWGNNPIPYQINNATNFSKAFSRVAYYMELVTGGTTTNWVYVSMDRFTTNVTKLGVPNQYSGEFYHYGAGGNGGGPISNANIRSNVAGISTGDGTNTINLEFWPSDYSNGNAWGVPGAAGTFDFGDGGASTGNGFGSMQIHNYGAGQTLFSYNNWNGGSTDIGIGIDPNTGRADYNPDWTFSRNGGSYTLRTLQILVGPYERTSVTWANPGVSNITTTSAVAYATLAVAGDSNAVATLYWGTSDAGKTNAGWAGTNFLGTVATGLVGNASMTSLAPDTTYYYRFYATNSATTNEGWSAAGVVRTVVKPAVDNGAGATVAVGRAALGGNLTAGNSADIYIYWGRTDGGVTTNYENVVKLPYTLQGAFSTVVNAGYGFSNFYYVCFASNAAGTAWSSASTNFTMPQPATGYTYSNGLRGSVFQPTADNQTPVDLTGAHYSNSLTRVFAGDKSGTVLTMSELPARNIVLQGAANSWNEFGGSPGEHFVAALSGRFFPALSGSYNFRWNEDDRGWLFIDLADDGVFDAGDAVGSYAWTGTGNATLTAGQGYNFMFFSQEYGGNDNLSFWYTPPGGSEAVVNPSAQPGQWRYAAGTFPLASITNTPVPVATLTTNSSTLSGSMYGSGWTFDAYAYWGRTNGLNVAGNWEKSAFVGTFHNTNGPISLAVADLAPTSQYYYAFFVTNTATNIWAQPSGMFQTVGPVTAENGAATAVTQTSATLGASLTAGGKGSLRIYWGLNDGGTNAGAWQNTNDLGEVLVGSYNSTVAVLAGAPYYYRAYATNAFGGDWADSTATFTSAVPAVSLSIANATFSETNGVRPVITATLSAPSVYAVTVNFGFSGTAAKGVGNDYTSSVDSIVIPALSLSNSIALGALDDALPEADETAIVSIGSLVSATNGVTASVTATLQSDDPQITNGGGASAIGQSAATLNGNLTLGKAATVKVFWGDVDRGASFAGWVATNPIGAGPVAEGAFSTNVTGLLANKTYYYRCYATNSSMLGEAWAPGTASFSTLTPSISIGDASVVEGDGGEVSATFSVTLSSLSATDVQVNFATSNGTAAAGLNYTATNGTVVIPAGQPGVTVTVKALGNTVFENPDKFFFMNLSSPVACTVARSQGKCTIRDDDAAPYLANWRNWMQITFSGYSGSTTLTNWPALVRFTNSIPGFDYTRFASGAGGDLRFASADRTRVLNFEFDQWNTNGESTVWVQVPELPPGGATIWAYWNNPDETALPAYATNGATWADGCVSVWHMNETSARDSSGLAHHGTVQGAVATAGGMIGQGNDFAGGYIAVPATTDYRMQTNDFSLSAWVYPHSNTDKGIFGSWGSGFILAVNAGNLSLHEDNPVAWNGTSPVSFNSWHFVTATRKGQDYRLYVDGNQGQQVTSAVNISNYGNFEIGSGGPGWRNMWDGVIDEPRIETKWRSADWVKASYSNQVQGSAFNSFGEVLGLPVIKVVDGATNITLNSACATARLTSAGGAPAGTWFYWGETDGGQVPGNWSHTLDMGAATTVPTNYSVLLSPLAASTPYFYAYAATNRSGTNWAAASFYTAGRPHVNNGSGAMPTNGYARLNGNLLSTGEALTTVCTYWGDTDGGTNALAWRQVITNTVSGPGPFSAVASNLFYGVQYFYRTYASNAYGEAWAPATAAFLTPKPLGGGAWSSSTAILSNVPEASGYDLIYQLDITANDNWTSGVGYNINNATNYAKTFSRIAYYLELLTTGGATNWVYVSMDRFTSDPTKTGVPSFPSGEFYHYGAGGNGGGPISNATIRSNVGTVTAGDGINTVNLEFWPYNYDASNGYGVPGANGGTYDFGDNSANAANYGSMQIHNYGASQTLFAYNHWNGGPVELGIGNQPAGNPDWTFSTGTTGNYSKRTLQVLVGPFAYSLLSLTNMAASDMTATSAVLNATLACTGAVYDVTAYWGLASGGTNAGLWAHAVPVGAWTNVVSTNLSCLLQGLSPSTDYFFTFRATNAADDMWATNAMSFTTPGPLTARFSAMPTICNPLLPVTFTDTSVPGLAGTIINRFWDFGDGTTTNTTATNLVHVYTQLGIKNVRLIVSDDLGGSSTNTKLAYIDVRDVQTAFTWTPTAAGTYNWDNAGPQDNWATSLGGAFPNAPGITAHMNIDLAGSQVVNLNQAVTIGTLNLGDRAAGFFTNTIQSGTGGSLVFDVTFGNAGINKTNAANNVTDTISAAITLNDPLVINNQAPGALMISGAIGGNSLVKTGGGTLILGSASNSLTSIAVSGGTLQGDAASIVTNVVLSNGANVTLNQAAPGVFGRVVSGAGSVTKTGSGTLTLTSAQSYSGATLLRGGTLQLRWSGGPNGIRITPTGDSITEGAGGSNAGYRGPLYNLLTAAGIQFQFVGTYNANPGSLPSAPVDQRYHEGHSGWQVGGILNGIKPVAEGGSGWLSVNPDIITLMIGTNNNGQDIPTVIGQLAQIIEQVHAQKPNTLLMVAIITPRTDGGAAWVVSYNAALVTMVNGKIAAGYNVMLVDLNTSYPAGTLPDNLHPNDAGYQWMARQWFNAIQASSGGGSDLLPVTTALTIATNAVLNLNGGSQQIASLSDDAGGGGVITNGNPAAASVLTIDMGAGSAAFSGRICDGTGLGTVSLVKSGAGTQVLSGSSAYSGGTTVSNGTLLVNNAAGTGTGAVTVRSGATLGGSGTVGGTVTVESGGALSPGAGIGAFVLGSDVDLQAGSTLRIDLNGVLGDTLVVGGNLNLSGTLAFATNQAPAAESYIIATNAGALTGTFASVTGLPAEYELVYDQHSVVLKRSGTLPPAPEFTGGAVTISGGVPTFRIGTVAGFKYGLDYRDSLTNGSWQPVISAPDFPPPEGWSTNLTGAPVTLTDTNAAGQPRRYYRLKAAVP